MAIALLPRKMISGRGRLFNNPSRNLQPEEKDYLDVLSGLVEDYGKDEHPITPASDSEMLRHLMEAKQVSQSEVANATGIAVSTISEVLAEKRFLNRRHIGKVARYFHVGPGVFQFGV